MIFGGKAGGFMAEFAKLIGEVRGLEFAPISRRILTMLLSCMLIYHEWLPLQQYY